MQGVTPNRYLYAGLGIFLCAGLNLCSRFFVSHAGVKLNRQYADNYHNIGTKAAGIKMALDRLKYEDVVEKVENLIDEQCALDRAAPRLFIPRFEEEKKEKKE